VVNFTLTAGGYSVTVGGEHFGWISKERGFFTDPTVVKKFLEVSSDDLRRIAEKADEVKEVGLVKKRQKGCKKDHDVRLDYVGLNGRARFTCYSEGCNGTTIVCQPYMTFYQWEEVTETFAKEHPCSKIKNEGFRG
jgi:hypothetical protein